MRPGVDYNLTIAGGKAIDFLVDDLLVNTVIKTAEEIASREREISEDGLLVVDSRHVRLAFDEVLQNNTEEIEAIKGIKDPR